MSGLKVAAQTCTLSGTGTILWDNGAAPACSEGGTASSATIIVIPAGVTLEFDDNGDTWTGTRIDVYGTLSISANGQVTINSSIQVKSTGTVQIASKLNIGSATGCGYTLVIENGGVVNVVGTTPDRLSICGTEIARGGTAGCSTYPNLPLPYCEPTGGFTGPVGFDEGGVSGPLPVELLFFKGFANQDRVILKWATATERNASYFALEKSLNGKDFQEIGQVSASGNSIFRIDYSFIDENALLGRNYYRLKQVDFDGAYEYFNITFVDTDGTKTVSVYPNPLQQNNLQFRLNYSTEDVVNVKIYNSTGVVVNSFSFLGTFYNDQTDLKSGTYLMKVAVGKDSYSRRFVIP